MNRDADRLMQALQAQRRSLVAGDADAIRDAAVELGRLLAQCGPQVFAGPTGNALRRELTVNQDLLARAAGRTHRALTTLVPQRTPTYDRSGATAISGSPNTQHIAA